MAVNSAQVRAITARVLGVVVFVGMVVAVFLGWVAAAHASTPTINCQHLNNSPKTVTVADVSPNAPQLAAQGSYTSSPPTIHFTGSNYSQQLPPYFFSANGTSLPDSQAIGWELNLIDGNHSLSSTSAEVDIAQDHGSIRVTLCLDPGNAPDGSYSGTLLLYGPNIKSVQLPLTVDIKFDWYWLIILGMIVASLIGLFVKWWMTKISSESDNNQPDFFEFGRWLFKKQLVTILIAVIASGYAVFFSKYLNVDSFKLGDCWGLWIATGTAVAATSLLTTTLGAQIKPTAEVKEETSNQVKKEQSAW